MMETSMHAGDGDSGNGSPASILWTDEAGSRTILLGVIKKGGPRKLAEHLVSDLRKALR